MYRYVYDFKCMFKQVKYKIAVFKSQIQNMNTASTEHISYK